MGLGTGVTCLCQEGLSPTEEETSLNPSLGLICSNDSGENALLRLSTLNKTKIGPPECKSPCTISARSARITILDTGSHSCSIFICISRTEYNYP